MFHGLGAGHPVPKERDRHVTVDMPAMYSPGQRPCGASLTSFHLTTSCILTHSRPSTKHPRGVGHWPVAWYYLLNQWMNPVTPSNDLLQNNLLSPPVRLPQCWLTDTDISTWCSFSRSTCVLSASVARYHDEYKAGGEKPKGMSHRVHLDADSPKAMVSKDCAKPS